MTDAQFATLIATILSGLAGIGTVIKWSVGRVVKSIDRNSDAMIENTKSNAVLATKIDGIATWIQDQDKVFEDSPFRRGNSSPFKRVDEEEPTKRRQTPGRGSPVRAGSRGGGDE